MFVVTGIDTDLNQKIEYEYESFDHALETYRSLKQDNTVENLTFLEYDLITRTYHMVDVNL